MSQTKLDPRLLDSAVALPAMSGSALTGLVSDFVLLATNTPSTDATSNFTQFNNATYSSYIFHFLNIKPDTDGEAFMLRTSTDGGSSYDTSGYKYVHHGYNTAGNEERDYSESAAGIYITSANNWGAAANESLSGEVKLFNAGASEYTKVTGTVSYDDDQAGLYLCNASVTGERTSAADVDAIQFRPTSGLITGTIKMYGVK